MSEANQLVGPMNLTPNRRWAITFGVLLGMFLAALEATIVATAMPTVVSSLGGLKQFSWVFSAYLITSTVTVPLWGKLSDIYGRRPLFQIGIVIFLLGSILSGFATSMPLLIAFRALQGLGAGALIPLAMTVIADIFTIEERARMQAVFSGVWGIASVIGPMAGGFITERMSWSWVFWINVPFGIAAATVVGLTLREPRRTSRPTIDYAGAGVLTLAITLLMLVLIESGEHAGSLFTARNLLLLAAVVVLFLWFLRIERRAVDPVMPLDLFSNRVVSIALIASFLAGVSMFCALSFVPLFAQGALGSTATAAGSLLTPLMLSWVILSIVGGRLMLKIGFRSTLIIGLSILTLGFALLSSFESGMPVGWLYAVLILVGSGLGLTMLTLMLAIQKAVPRTQLGIATSLSQFSRSIGGAVGVAVMGVVLSASLSTNLGAMAARGESGLTPEMAARFAANPNALIEPVARAAMPVPTLHLLQQAMSGAIHNVFWVGTALAALALICVFRLPLHRSDTQDTPAPEMCSPETGERMVVAEMTTLDAEHEPESVTTAAESA